MADEQTPQSDLIDDAIRNAEQQLEAKLRALRLSALGEEAVEEQDETSMMAPVTPDSDDDPWASISADTTPPEPTPAGDESVGEAAVLRPTGASAGTYAETWNAGGAGSAWRAPASGSDSGVTLDPHSYTPDADRAPRAQAPISSDMSTALAPSEEEIQFWAQTRTALRALQQGTESMPRDVATAVGRGVEQIIRDELSGSVTAVRGIQQQIQHGLPKLAERMESIVRDEMDAAAAPARQLTEEMPVHVDRIVRDVSKAVDTTVASHGKQMRTDIQTDSRQSITELERVVATNVARMTTSLGAQVARVESTIAVLDSSLGELGGMVEDTSRRIEDVDTSSKQSAQAIHSLDARFDELDRQIRAELLRVDASIRTSLDSSASAAVRTEALLLERIEDGERAIVEELRTGEREMSGVLTSILDANKMALDRFSTVVTELDRDRVTRGEDLELLIDTMSAGWESMSTAIGRLFEQNQAAYDRLERIDERFAQLHDIEAHVDSVMNEVKRHVEELKPAPVVVTVNHPEAQVSNSTRGGFSTETS